MSPPPSPFVQFHDGKDDQRQEEQDSPTLQADSLGAEQQLTERCMHCHDMNQECQNRASQQYRASQR